jgi:hypothetical protein
MKKVRKTFCQKLGMTLVNADQFQRKTRNGIRLEILDDIRTGVESFETSTYRNLR